MGPSLSATIGEGERFCGVGGGEVKPNSRASSKFRVLSILRTLGSLRYFDRRRSCEDWCVEALEDGGLEGDGVGERNESLRRKEEKLLDREGGGELGGEIGETSRERVGENDTGASSGAHPIVFNTVEGLDCEGAGCAAKGVLSIDTALITIGLLRFMSDAASSSFTRGGSGSAVSKG